MILNVIVAIIASCVVDLVNSEHQGITFVAVLGVLMANDLMSSIKALMVKLEEIERRIK